MRNTDNGYDRNGQDPYWQPDNNYNYPNPNPQYGNNSSNSGLIAVIAVLSSLIIIGAVILVLILTNVISIGGNKSAADASSTAPAVTAAPQPIPAPVNNTVISQKYVANVKYSIYFRSEPVENDSNIICEIPLGTQVGFIENANTVFAKINYNGSIGYAKQQYLSDYMPNISSNTTISSYMYVANVKYSIYFRSEPRENSGNIICEIPLGTMVGFIERADNVFSKINYNGSIGYVKTEYLSTIAPGISYSSVGSTMTVVNVAYAIYLRSSPSESSDSNIIAEIPVGATVTYLGTPDNTFYKISYGGMVGYSKQIYLSFN